MAETIELELDDLTASVSTAGAWVQALAQSGRPILFPKQSFTVANQQKERGGCHVCLPNFGPGGDSDQPQHGYGRLLEWEVTDRSAAAVSLQLERGTGMFAMLSSRLRYELMTNGFSMQLDVENHGNEPLPLSSGFHPYFGTAEAENVGINGLTYALNTLGEAQFLEGDNMRLKIGESAFDLRSEGLSKWALWSDRLATYVCLEPTTAGNGFQDGTSPIIEPGKTMTSRFSIQPVS